MRWNVKEIAEARGITNARALAGRAGVPAPSMYQIWNGMAKRADLDTLNKLCNTLRVPLALLLEHVPDAVELLPGDSQQTASATPGKPARKRAAKT